MLILTRKKNESIMIGDNIEIVVTDIQDGKVKLGIKAPKNVDIHRKEIYVDIQNENKVAADGEVDLDRLKNLF
ncbi:carbon storage regulator CsrA [Senegalia massiliensis]|uniref:carbon storage regulator CsrA n=1 Tax=Senegalia massiliensis TaxID=1720316 RepID=UPI001031C4A1|nr:carbon storage regulator CsrA [Senegalia massiliensis]